MIKAKEIFMAEAIRMFEFNRPRFENFLAKLDITEQIEIIKGWVKKIDILYNEDITLLKDKYYNNVPFNLSGIIKVSFTEIQVRSLREIRDNYFDLSAITSTDIQKCIEDDIASEKRLELQLIVKEHNLLYNFFNEKLRNLKHSSNKIPVNSDTKEKKEILILTGIDIPKLVNEMQKRNFFGKEESTHVKNWLTGIPATKKIQLNAPSNRFLSVIADLKDKAYIKNSKKILYQSINESFLSDNEEIKVSYIEKTMKPNGENRITTFQGDNYLNINLFALPL